MALSKAQANSYRDRPLVYLRTRERENSTEGPSPKALRVIASLRVVFT